MAATLHDPHPPYHFETLALHAGQETPDPATGARVVPIYQTASYVFPDSASAEARFRLEEAGNIYTRITNPTTDAFERRIAALEGGASALAVASGSAAITYSILNLARAGDHIVAASSLYGGTYHLLAHTLQDMGIEVTFVDAMDPAAFGGAIRENTKAVFFESLDNPHSQVPDIEAIAAEAHAKRVPVIVDNTFATPFLLRPLERGADIVVHSATKFIGGHGTSIGGVLVDGGRFDWQASGRFPGLTEPSPGYHGLRLTEAAGPLAYIVKARVTLLRDTGAALSPFHSFLFLQGLETLSLRVERHVANALAVVRFLSTHPAVERISHPSILNAPSHSVYQRYFPHGAGTIFTFDVRGGAEAARSVIDRLQLFSLLANVADAKSLVIHPASTTHSQLSEAELSAAGIHPGTIRLSIGLEHIDDLLYDLAQALRPLE